MDCGGGIESYRSGKKCDIHIAGAAGPRSPHHGQLLSHCKKFATWFYRPIALTVVYTQNLFTNSNSVQLDNSNSVQLDSWHVLGIYVHLVYIL